MAIKQITITRGKTFSQLIRWETTPIIYRAITAITQSAPVRITAPAHGMTNGWRAAVVSVKGMREINAEDPTKLRDKDYHEVTVIDGDTVEINDINAAEFSAYTSGGYLQFNTPHDLTGYVCRMKIKDKVGGTVLLSTESSDAPNNLISAQVDATSKTITVQIAATVTETLVWKKGVCEIEMESPAGVVESLIAPTPVVIGDEVVTA